MHVPGITGLDFSWTNERVEHLKIRYAAGQSAGQIAAEMDVPVSRNAIVGKIHRLGLVRPGRADFKPTSSKSPARATFREEGGMIRRIAKKIETSIGEAVPRPSRNGPAGKLVETPAGPKLMRSRVTGQGKVMTVFDAADALTDLPPDQSPNAVRFLDRAGETCRWPLNDVVPIDAHMVCNTVCGNHSYCVRHRKIAQQSYRPRTVELSDAVRAQRAMTARKNLAAYKERLASA